MIVMKIRILLSLGLLASLTIGCEDLKFGDDFLEKPNSDEVPIDTVFASKKYADQAMNQFYKSLGDFLPTLNGCHPGGRCNQAQWNTLLLYGKCQFINRRYALYTL